MPRILAALMLSCACIHAHSQTVRVVKVKGKKAVVETVSGKLMVGQTIGGGGSSGDDFDLDNEGGGGGHSGPRTHFVGGSGSFTTYKTGGSNSSSVTAMSASLLYGWNPGKQLEYGGLVSFGMVSGTAKTTTMSIGGKVDWDFAPNKAPLESLFAVSAEAAYGRTSSGSVSSNVMSFFPMASWKYFILKTPTCVRVDGGMRITRTSSSGTSTNESNPVIQVGLYTYF